MSRMKPYTLTMELARGESTASPFEFRYTEQEYLLRREEGYLSARLSWDSQFQEDLAELSHPSPSRDAVQRLGDTLGTFLGKLGWGAHEARLEEAIQQGREVHITFRLAAGELYSLPWELVTLRGSGQHLGELPGCHLHYEWPGVPVRAAHAARVAEGGRILFAWSAAGGHVPAAEHLDALREVCARNEYPFDPARDVIDRVSLRALSQVLAASDEPVAALHILCHGARSPVPRSSEYGLQWNASQEEDTSFVDAGDLRQVLAPHAGKVRMVVLCACQSGNAVPDNHLGSVAQSLHRVGIPAVVASRMPLTVRGSIQLTETLYEELLGQLSPLSRALSAVRSRLQEEAESLDWASLQMYARAGDAVALRPFVFRPYRGLLAFKPKHQRFFFGREALQEELLRRMESAVEGKLPRFQLVAGASGSGKSSLVMAGLMPRLSKERWDIAVLRPGEAGEGGPSDLARPRTLAALQAVLRRYAPLEAPAAAPASFQEGILEEARRLRLAHPQRKLLLVVDQFEEVFTQIASPEEGERFVRTLWELSRDPALGLVVLATLRVDYFERCGELRLDEVGTRLDIVVYDDAHRLFVPQLQPDQLRLVIEGPAHRVGLELEEWLTEQLQRDVGQEPGALPLLEYTLDLLWQRREGAVLTQRAYEELGGVAGALTRTVDQLIDGMTPAEQQQARRLLVEMVDFRDASTPYTRRRVWVVQVRPEAGALREAFDSVHDTFVASRLLVRGGDGATPGSIWLQVAHEALLRRWERLATWVREDRERVLQLRELQSWADGWNSHRGDPDGGASYLLTGDRLGYARSLQEKYPGNLSGMSVELIVRSQAAHERRRRAARNRVVLTLCASLLVALGMGGLALRAWRSQQEAQKAALISAADALRSEDPTSASLLLREVGGQEGNMTWVRSAFQVLQEPISQAILVGHGGPLRAIALSPDGTRVLTASEDGTARLWRVDGSGEPTVLAGHGGKLTAAAFSPDGRRVVTASADGTARVWSTSDAHEPIVLQGHGRELTTAAFSPDGQRVVTASMDGTARVWLLEGDRPVVLQGHSGPVLDARFSPDGSRVVTASMDHTARIWQADGQGTPLVLAGHTQQVRTASFNASGDSVVTASADATARVWLADGSGELMMLGPHDMELTRASFSPDDRRVVTATVSGMVRVWSTHGAGRPLVLEGHRGKVTVAAFSPDGRYILTASSDGTARVWNAHRVEQPHILRGHEKDVVAAAFGANSMQILTASLDGTGRVWTLGGGAAFPMLEGGAPVFSPDGLSVVTLEDGMARLWPLEGEREPVRLPGETGSVSRAMFSPDGRVLLTLHRDGAVRLWPGDGKGEPRVLRGHTAEVLEVAFAPGGKWLATASADSTARLWPLKGEGEPRVLRGHAGKVLEVGFSSNGKWVATAADDGTARLWSLDGQSEPRVLRGKEGGVPDIDFSPDGRWLVASSDTVGWLWPLDGQEEPRALQGHKDRVLDVGFSPDGKWVLTASADSTARLWPLEGKGEPRVLQGHTQGVAQADFSLDGKWVATASYDGTVRLWPLDAQGEPLVLTGHEDIFSSLGFSPDGRWVARSSFDRTARLWAVDGKVPPIVLRSSGEMTLRFVTFSPKGGRVAISADSRTQIWSLSAQELEARLSQVTTACLAPMQRRQLLGEEASTARSRHEACEQDRQRRELAGPPPPTKVPVAETRLEREQVDDVSAETLNMKPRSMIRLGVWGLGGSWGALATAHVTGTAKLIPSQFKSSLQEASSLLSLDLSSIQPGVDSVPTERAAAAAWLSNQVIPVMTRQIAQQYGEESAALFEVSLRANALAVYYEPGPEGAARGLLISEELQRLLSRAKLPAEPWAPLHRELEAGASLKKVMTEAHRAGIAMNDYLSVGL